MNYQIEKQSDVPSYIQLYRLFVHDIVTGVYPYGSKLPSKRVTAEETGVSVITVDHAIGLLSEEGYVQTRQRSGVFVIYKGEDFLSDAEPLLPAPGLLKDHIPHGTGSFPFSVLKKTMHKVLLDEGEEVLTRSPNQGCEALRNEICRYLARSRGIEVKPSQVIIGSGAEYLYGLIAQLLRGSKVFAVEDPSYGKIRSVYEAMGIRCEMLPMSEGGISSSALEKTKAKVLHVTPFNSYPSGITAGISKKHEYLRWAGKRDAIVIEDNYDSELTVSRKAEVPLFSMDKEGRVIYINTFSKTLAPSMRMGYMILPENMVGEFTDKLGFYSCPVPVFDQYVIAELLRNGDFERHINRERRKRRRALEKKR
ncbi:MAG: PLP-dependent aminotransferase family protein [Lachnospiraceae bacterium]|nr:PLP-dependent aminotransferase family protein [Clostridiales bacterium]MBR7090069.1 PLP-dependent aminotransferase family protein [Lachnospiraceae bacterium]